MAVASVDAQGKPQKPPCCRVEHGDKGLDECLEGAFTPTSLKSFVSHHFTFLLMSTSGAHHGQGSSS